MNITIWRFFILIYVILTASHLCLAQISDLAKQDSLKLLYYSSDSTQVVLKNVNTEKYGCVDTSGNLIVSFDYDYIGNLKDGLRLAVIDSKYGYLNVQGDKQIAFDYLGGNHFSNGKAIVINTQGFGVIDNNNEIIIPFNYGSLSTADHRYYSFKKTGGKLGIMDSLEKVVVPAKYDNISLENDSIWIAMLDRKFELYKYNGERLLNERINRIGRSSYSGYKSVGIEGKTGILDEHFNWVLPPVYKAVTSLFENSIGAKDSLGWKVYNAKHEQIIDEVFEEISYLNKTQCIIRKDQKENVINNKGERLLHPNTSTITKINGEKILLHIDGYLYDGLELNKVLPDQVNLLSTRPSFKKGLLVVKVDGKCAIVDTSGNYIIPPQYNYCEDLLSFGYLKVRDNESGNWGLVNIDNELVVPIKYKYIDHSGGSYADAQFWLEDESSKNYFSNQRILVSDIDSIVGYLGDFIFIKKNKQLGFINTYKDTFRTLEYDSIIINGFPLIVINDGKYGTLDYDGNLDIPCKYDYLRAAGSYLIIKEGDKYGTLSKSSVVLEAPKFDRIEKGIFKLYGKVYINDKIGLLDTEGTLLLPVEYDTLDVKVNGQVTATKGDESFNYNCLELEIKTINKPTLK